MSGWGDSSPFDSKHKRASSSWHVAYVTWLATDGPLWALLFIMVACVDFGWRIDEDCPINKLVVLLIKVFAYLLTSASQLILWTRRHDNTHTNFERLTYFFGGGMVGWDISKSLVKLDSEESKKKRLAICLPAYITCVHAWMDDWLERILALLVIKKS